MIRNYSVQVQRIDLSWSSSKHIPASKRTFQGYLPIMNIVHINR
ncbi:uncharacterized protein METZ01_LOCUS134149 [marine metagenome]|uniref:Uncharacterized protein n=1 Tax=marine metagenome TaxID=408172 RepID=A0A381YWA5_9ZZZZ